MQAHASSLAAAATVLLAACTSSSAQPAAPAATVINFDGLAPGTTVTTQLGPQGVIFYNAYVQTDTGAHSGARILRSHNPAGEFDSGALRFDFSTGQRYVKLYAGAMFESATGTLRLFDASGNQVAQDGPKTVAPGAFATVFRASAAGPVIRRAELQYAGTAFEGIDDLEFGGNAPVPPPTTPPVVSITVPANGQQFTTGSTSVRGTVTGDQVYATATLRSVVMRPPGSVTTSSYTSSLPLSGTGTTRGFSTTSFLEVGPQWLTVTASNSANLSGTATARVDYFPQLIRDRFAAEGGAATFGDFSFGAGPAIAGAACTYAVYASGAVAASAGASRVVRGNIFSKWRSLKDAGSFPRLGCPTSDPRSVAGGATAQDFQNGRIYTSSSGSYYVNPVFARAIDVLGGEAATGTPVADPTSNSQPAYQVWQFQQFRKPGASLLSTLEIQGATPRLRVWRQGGDGSLYTGIPISAATPTQMVSFPCTTTAGPCSVTAPVPEVPFQNPGAFCNNETFNWAELLAHVAAGNLGYTPTPPEWAPIFGNYVQTPFYGVVKHVGHASGDNPWAHENSFEPCPTPTIEALANETICPSDWDVDARGLPGFAGMQSSGRDFERIEFERYFSQYFFTGWGEPRPGDLLFASGRYIVDCGHNENNWKTEIHPPSVLAFMRNETWNGRPSTQANIWVNGFFTGEAVEFDIIPPPRPSPTATLGYIKPIGSTLDVTVTALTPESNRVRVRVTSPTLRHVKVTSLGEMKWQTGRGYEGRWHVYWNP